LTDFSLGTGLLFTQHDLSNGYTRNDKGDTMFRRLGIFSELWYFLRTSKKWWLGPILVFLLLISLLVVFTESSALAPFIYSLF